jgi:hypothetical protein
LRGKSLKFKLLSATVCESIFVGIPLAGILV